MAAISDSATLEGGSNVKGHMGWDRVSKASVLRRPWGKMQMGNKGWNKTRYLFQDQRWHCIQGWGKTEWGVGARVGNPPLIFTSNGFPLSSRASAKTEHLGQGLCSPLFILSAAPAPSSRTEKDTDGWAIHSLLHSTHPFIKRY